MTWRGAIFGESYSKVWALDRNTFKKILSEAAFKRRKANEELLARAYTRPLFSST
jgi:predicted oxidoreductase (fatty acid repression mutant protein)